MAEVTAWSDVVEGLGLELAPQVICTAFIPVKNHPMRVPEEPFLLASVRRPKGSGELATPKLRFLSEEDLREATTKIIQLEEYLLFTIREMHRIDGKDSEMRNFIEWNKHGHDEYRRSRRE